MVYILLCFFFFQAEDGIRDLVRSRGLGDVYKRQVLTLDEAEFDEILEVFERLGTVDSGKLGPAHAALDGQYLSLIHI